MHRTPIWYPNRDQPGTWFCKPCKTSMQFKGKPLKPEHAEKIRIRCLEQFNRPEYKKLFRDNNLRRSISFERLKALRDENAIVCKA